jgi:hypothetical protein
MHEHIPSGFTIAHQPHPQRLYAWVFFACGCVKSGWPPVHFDAQSHVDEWFLRRRDTEQLALTQTGTP